MLLIFPTNYIYVGKHLLFQSTKLICVNEGSPLISVLLSCVPPTSLSDGLESGLPKVDFIPVIHVVTRMLN